MFEQILGLPAHPLLLHATVVFVPLLAIGSIIYAIVPGLRRRIWWLVGLLALAGAGSAFLTRMSGVAFKARLMRHGISGPTLAKITQHQNFGDATMWSAISLGAVTLALLVVAPGWGARNAAASTGADGPTVAVANRRNTGVLVLSIILALATVGLAGASLYYVFKTGDSGARIVWSGS